MYALLEIKGKQYKAEKGKELKVDLLALNEGDEVTFDKVLMISDDGNAKVGTPFVEGATVKTVVKEAKVADKKIKVFKMKRRKGYRRTQGHRQKYSLITVQDIQG